MNQGTHEKDEEKSMYRKEVTRERQERTKGT